MKNRGRKLLRAATAAVALVGIGTLLAEPGRAAPILASPQTFTHCGLDSRFLDDPASCSLSGVGHATASLTLSPFVNLAADAASPANDANGVHGAAATASVTYSFQVVGGNTGDIVPLLIATNLFSAGSDPTHGVGFASLSVHTTAAGDSFVAVCSDSTCGSASTSFSGTLSTRARSGDTANTLTLFVQAGTGDSLRSESAKASADPFIFVDPAFPSAGLYSIEVSAGVGNAEPVPVPEPAGPARAAMGILMCSVAAVQWRRSQPRFRQGVGL